MCSGSGSEQPVLSFEYEALESLWCMKRRLWNSRPVIGPLHEEQIVRAAAKGYTCRYETCDREICFWNVCERLCFGTERKGERNVHDAEARNNIFMNFVQRLVLEASAGTGKPGNHKLWELAGYDWYRNYDTTRVEQCSTWEYNRLGLQNMKQTSGASFENDGCPRRKARALPCAALPSHTRCRISTGMFEKFVEKKPGMDILRHQVGEMLLSKWKQNRGLSASSEKLS